MYTEVITYNVSGWVGFSKWREVYGSFDSNFRLVTYSKLQNIVLLTFVSLLI